MSPILRRLTLALLAAAAGAGAASAQDGAALFAQNCAACHQPTGKGIPGAFPPLAGSKFVQGPAATVAKTVLVGRGGMPTFREELTDQQIASILTYVRSAWGNKAPAVDVATVAAGRGKSGVAENKASVLPYH